MSSPSRSPLDELDLPQPSPEELAAIQFSQEIHSVEAVKIHPWKLHFESGLVEAQFQQDILLSEENIQHIQRNIPFIIALNAIFVGIHFIQIGALLSPQALLNSLVIRLASLFLSFILGYLIVAHRVPIPLEDDLDDEDIKQDTDDNDIQLSVIRKRSSHSSHESVVQKDDDQENVSATQPLFQLYPDTLLGALFCTFASQSLAILVESPDLYFNSAFVLLHIVFIVLVFNVLHWRFLSSVIIAHSMGAIYILPAAVVLLDTLLSSSDSLDTSISIDVLSTFAGIAGALALSSLLAFQQEKISRKSWLLRQLLDEESAKSEELLERLLPSSVIEELMKGNQMIATGFEDIGVLFTYFANFDELSTQLSALELVELLNEVYYLFDNLTEIHRVFKVETIGEVYMVCCGAPDQLHSNNTIPLVNLARDMQRILQLFPSPIPGNPNALDLKIGIHIGPLVAGVVSTKLPRYRLFGDTVNTASRMCSHCPPNEVQLSSDAANDLKETIIEVKSRGEIDVKGKGLMELFLLVNENEEDDTAAPPPTNEQVETPELTVQTSTPSQSPEKQRQLAKSPGLPESPRSPRSPTARLTPSSPSLEVPNRNSRSFSDQPGINSSPEMRHQSPRLTRLESVPEDQLTPNLRHAISPTISPSATAMAALSNYGRRRTRSNSTDNHSHTSSNTTSSLYSNVDLGTLTTKTTKFTDILGSTGAPVDLFNFQTIKTRQPSSSSSASVNTRSSDSTSPGLPPHPARLTKLNKSDSQPNFEHLSDIARRGRKKNRRTSSAAAQHAFSMGQAMGQSTPDLFELRERAKMKEEKQLEKGMAHHTDRTGRRGIPVAPRSPLANSNSNPNFNSATASRSTLARPKSLTSSALNSSSNSPLPSSQQSSEKSKRMTVDAATLMKASSMEEMPAPRSRSTSMDGSSTKLSPKTQRMEQKQEKEKEDKEEKVNEEKEENDDSEPVPKLSVSQSGDPQNDQNQSKSIQSAARTAKSQRRSSTLSLESMSIEMADIRDLKDEQSNGKRMSVSSMSSPRPREGSTIKRVMKKSLTHDSDSKRKLSRDGSDSGSQLDGEDDEDQIPSHPWLLKFYDQQLELFFGEYLFGIVIKHVRMGFVMACVATIGYILIEVLDPSTATQGIQIQTVGRFILLGVCLANLAATFHPSFRKGSMQMILLIGLFLMGTTLGILTILDNLFNPVVYAMFVVFCFSVAHLNYLYGSGLALVGMIIFVFFPIDVNFAAETIVCLLSIGFVCGYGSWFIERKIRADFWSQYLFVNIQRKADMLISNLLPEPVMEQLRSGSGIVADLKQNVPVLFCDVVGFTSLSAEITPEELVGLLSEIYSTFDQLVDKHKLYKVETIGDCYMVAGNLFEGDDTEAVDLSQYEHIAPSLPSTERIRTISNTGTKASNKARNRRSMSLTGSLSMSSNEEEEQDKDSESDKESSSEKKRMNRMSMAAGLSAKPMDRVGSLRQSSAANRRSRTESVNLSTLNLTFDEKGMRFVGATVAMARLGLDMLDAIKDIRAPNGQTLDVRVGIHICKKAVAGCVGRKMPRYHVFGDEVRFAESMEQSGIKGHVQVSSGVRFLIEQYDDFKIEKRNAIHDRMEGAKSREGIEGSTYIVSRMNE